MCYTDEQRILIGAMIGANFMGRNLSPDLRDGFTRAYADLESKNLTTRDLRLIQGALELMTQSCSKEGYRDMIEALYVTRRMLSEAEAATA